MSREIVLSLPNICSALCLNEHGLIIFNEHKPLTQIFRIIFSSSFMQVIRKRKNDFISAGGQLGIHFDEFMRHQPTLRKELIFALVTILDELISKANSADINVSTRPSKTSPDDTDSKAKTEQEPLSAQPKKTFAQAFGGWTGFFEEKLKGLREEHEKRFGTFEIHFNTRYFSRRSHLVAEANNEKQTNFDFVQDGNYMPLSDYMILAIKMIEAILSNSTLPENSSAMIESKLMEKLLSFFKSDRVMPITSNQHYTNSLPNVFRLLLTQSRFIQPFVVISQIIKEQLMNFELPDNSTDLTTQSKINELGRLASLVSVFLSFLKSALASNVQEGRGIIFQYLSNDTTGVKFIGEIMEIIQKFGKSIAHFNKEFRESVLFISRKNTIAQPAPQISVEITTTTNSEEAENTTSTANLIKDEPTTSSSPGPPPISAPYSSMTTIYKNLMEIVCQVGRSANPARTRRIPEGSYLTDTNKIAEELLTGVRKILENVDYGNNW